MHNFFSVRSVCHLGVG